MHLARRVKARLLWAVTVAGTAYVALWLLACMLLLPRLTAKEESGKTIPLQVPSQQFRFVPIRHSLSKRGERVRNVSFSSEAHDDNSNQSDSEHRPHANTKSSFPRNLTFASSNSTKENNFRETQLSDVFIGVKTTEKYHNVRLPLLFQTWLDDDNVRKQTYIFSDAEDIEYSKMMKSHFINTHCPNQHARKDLCCKMGVIFTAFLKSEKRWWCNVDDDNYINISNLLSLLRAYRHDKDHYLGRSSTSSEIVVFDRGYKRNGSMQASSMPEEKAKRKKSFWFATGGAGVCISRSLALKMAPYAGNGQFLNVCNRIFLPDDVSIGFLIVDLLGVHLTKIADMHSHLTILKKLQEEHLKRAITLSYRVISESQCNCIRLKDAAFNKTEDPTRMLSLHCMLHPDAPVCPGVGPKSVSTAKLE